MNTSIRAAEQSGRIAVNRKAGSRENWIARLTVGVPALSLLAAIPVLLVDGITTVNVVLLIVFYSLSVVGIGAGFHRMASHTSFKTKAPIRAALAIMGSIAAQGPVLHWAATHRHHHGTSDRAKDFHSPYIKGDEALGRAHGLLHAHVGWLFETPYADWPRYIPDLLHDHTLCKVNKYYLAWIFAGLALPVLIACAITPSVHAAVTAFFWAGLVRIGLVQNSTWSVNSICHVWGTRPFESRDLSANNPVVAVLTFGEGWHNNHHAFPTSARHGLRWWEIDLNGYIVEVLRATGLAWDVRKPSQDQIRQQLLK